MGWMKERMLRGELYRADDPELVADHARAQELLDRYTRAPGASTFVNHDCVFLDAAPITIGDNVWLGGGVIVCPGVTIGEHTVVGAGAVVVRDLPARVVAVGTPARVLREVGDRDRIQVPVRSS